MFAIKPQDATEPIERRHLGSAKAWRCPASNPARTPPHWNTHVVALGTIPAWALLGDRTGRKPVFLVGALASAALIWPFIWAVSHRNIVLVFVIGILLSGIVYPAHGGVGFALFGEQFSTKVRTSGVAVGTEFGIARGGFAPRSPRSWRAQHWRTGFRWRFSAAPPRWSPLARAESHVHLGLPPLIAGEAPSAKRLNNRRGHRTTSPDVAQ